MLAITLSDLRHRRRQFLIAVVGAGLVFALALLLSGLVAGFHNEIRRTVGSFHADTWIVPARTSGPFTSVAAMPAQALTDISHAPGVRTATPLVTALQTAIVAHDASMRVVLIGAQVGSFGQIVPSTGRAVARDGEAVVDARTFLRTGDRITVNGHVLAIVGVVHGRTILGGSPDVWTTLHDAQAVVFGGQNLLTTVVTQGSPASLPDTLKIMSPQEVRKDTMTPMISAVQSINNTRWFMWAVAAIIVAALVYVSALQRLRDFAVMKAVGASSKTLFAGVTVQAVVITTLAAALAASTANLLKPIYTIPVEVPIGGYLWLPVVAMVVGVLSALVALRQAVTVDPALAFGAN